MKIDEEDAFKNCLKIVKPPKHANYRILLIDGLVVLGSEESEEYHEELINHYIGNNNEKLIDFVKNIDQGKVDDAFEKCTAANTSHAIDFALACLTFRKG